MSAFAGGALVLHIRGMLRSLHIRFGRAPAQSGVRCDGAMTDTDAATDRSTLVHGAHRLVRAVDTSEGPFAGQLVSFGDGVAVSVDIADLSGWPGWTFSGSEHVCGVLDIRRRADGHDALLPWCTQRVETFLGRRLAADAALSPGELGTLVASLLRGVREMVTDAESAVGDWWLTGDGLPLFVHGDGGAARARTAALVERMTAHTGDRATVRMLGETVAALREHRHHEADDRRWEEQLFSLAAPRALRLDRFAPERASEVLSRRSARLELETVPRVRGRRQGERTEGDTPIARIRAAGAVVVERARAALSRLKDARGARSADPRKQGRSRPAPTAVRSRRRPLIVAAALAAVVLAVGLLWPQSGEDGPAEAAERVTSTPSPDAGANAATEKSPPPVDGPTENSAEDPMAALPRLVDAIAECIQATAEICADAMVDGAGTPSDGLIAHGSAASSATLIDDYGDLAVARLAPIAETDDLPEQMIVLERREDEWLVRDVYDVAHQPE